MQDKNVISFNIEKKINVEDTFRVAKIKGHFDINDSDLNERFEGQIELPESWNIGVIVGNSGTGKTTIMKEIQRNYRFVNSNDFNNDLEYTSKSVIDDMPKKCTEDEIERMFYNVGFGSTPCWLKPYHVLSNGEKLRVDIARLLLTYDTIFIDEFTSVVDRDVAKIMCIAISKYCKKNKDKKIIVSSCHFDILNFLDADWIFNTNNMRQVFQNAHVSNLNLQSKNVQKMSGQSLGSIII